MDQSATKESGGHNLFLCDFPVEKAALSDGDGKSRSSMRMVRSNDSTPQGSLEVCATSTPGSASDLAYIRAAVLAPRCGGVQVVGETRRTGLGRGRLAKHRLARASHNVLVGHNDQEIHDPHKDNEVDNAGDEGSQVEIRAIATAGDQLPAQSGALNAALRRGDQRVDDVVGERLDQITERQGHGQANSGDNDIAPHQEVSETPQHCHLSSSG